MDEHLATRDRAAGTTVLAAAIEEQRRVLERHAEVESRRLAPTAIHELRVSIRRLLTALALADALGLSVTDRGPRRLRKLLSRLGAARDAHVQLRHLSELLPAHPGAAPMLEELKQRRRRAARRARKQLRRFALREHDQDVASVLAALHAVPRSSAASSAALLGQLAQRHLTIEHQRRGASADEPAALHAVRLAFKDYRYAIEALAPALPDAARRVAQTCEELQNLLGSAHDTYLLAETARGLARAGDSSTAQPLVALAEALDELSRAAHADAATKLARSALPWPFSSSLNLD